MNNFLMRRAFAVVCIALALLSASLAFASSPLLGAEAAGSGAQADAVLYFRYAGTPWLAPQARRLAVPPTQTVAEAVVRALIRGPEPASPALIRLIPQDTEVLSVQEDGGVLFVTLSGAFLDPLPGEDQGEDAALRRRLMTASLANALTQGGEYRAVQVLVMRESAVSSSMRLSARAYLEDSDEILPPLARREEDILTPGRALSHVLSFWQARDVSGMLPYVAAAGQPAGEAFAPQAATLPTLLRYEASPGTPSPDGSHAVVTLAASGLDARGQEREISGFPVRLEWQDGIFKINPASLAALAAMLGGAP